MYSSKLVVDRLAHLANVDDNVESRSLIELETIVDDVDSIS